MIPAYILTFAVLMSACVTGGKRLAELELAATNPIELEKLCAEGLTGACALQGKSVVLDKELSIMQGVSSATQSRFAVIAPKKEKLIYYARTAKTLKKLDSERIERKFSPNVVDQVEAFGLDVRETYELIAINAHGMLSDRRQFRPLDTSKKRPKIIVISCMDDKLKVEQALMWKQLLSEQPDVILMIGDNVYADRKASGWAPATAEQLWDRYIDTRMTLDFFKSPVLYPVFATWDDHDFGRNDSDRTYALKDESARVFHTFFPQARPAPGFERGPGVASKWTAYGLQFLLLDDRTFRSPNRVDLPDQTHFGIEQENWIAAELAAAKGPVALVNGNQFFGGYHSFESFEGSHPKNFATQLARWKKAKIPMLFISGDRHLSEIIQVPKQAVGQATFELTSSPLHAKVFPDAFSRHPSPNQLVGVAGQYNYMAVEPLKVSGKSLQLKVRSMGQGKRTFFEKNLTVKGR